MGIIQTMRRQKAVYWALKASDGYGGWTYENPVEINCRWEDVREEKMDAEGNLIQTSATVYADRELGLNGMVYRGELDGAVTNEPQAMDPHLVHKICKVERLPNLRNTEILHTVTLCQ